MSENPSISLILLAGGKGVRMGSAIPKQFLPLNKKPIVLYSYEIFLSISAISEIIVVCGSSYISFFEKPSHLPLSFASPGDTRQASLFSGAAKVSSKTTHLLIHDAARPFVTKEEVEKLLAEGLLYPAATLASPMTYTVKEVDPFLLVTKTLTREKLYQIHTPQLIRKDILQKGQKKVEEENLSISDDVSLAEILALPVKIVIGSSKNLKITTKEDLLIAKVYTEA